MGMAVSGGAVNSTPNVTPMIDVMLVLLIIFMITIPQLNAGFTATPPQGQNLKSHPEEDSDQVLGIDAEGNYWFNKSLIRQEDLEAMTRNIFTPDREEKILYVKAHKDLTYDKVLEALDVVAKGGVSVAALISEQVPGTESLVESDRPVAAAPAPGGN
jgi:biopolymer transport protein TolR